MEAACLPLGSLLWLCTPPPSHHPTWEREEAVLCPQGPLGLEGDGLLQGNTPRLTLIGEGTCPYAETPTPPVAPHDNI